MTRIRFAQAITQALDEEMERDEQVILLGEDIGRPGGSFGVTKGLLDKYGGRYPGLSDGAATYAVGSLASLFIQKRLTPTGIIPTTPAGMPAAAGGGAASGAALAGVPASGGSAAFETAGPGY